MDGHRFRVPIALCNSDDLHFLRRRLIPLDQYFQEINECLSLKGCIDRRLLERAILAEVKRSGLLKGIYRFRDMRRRLLEHKRATLNSKALARKLRVQKARKVKNETCRLDPTVKVFAVVGGSLVPCKGNNFRVRYAYTEGANYSSGVTEFVSLPEQQFTHDAEENALPDEVAAFRKNQPSSRIRDALKIRERDYRSGATHVMPNAEVRGDAPLYGAASLSTDGFGGADNGERK